jgi:hypothetical protein
MLKRLFIVVALAALCVGSGFTQTRNSRRASAPAEAAFISIIQVDFRAYTFPLNGKSYKLIDGFYAENVAPDRQWGLEMADGPFYGDLTGDRREEAAIVLRHGPVGSPDMAEARVYTLRNGRPALLASFTVADAVNCDLDHYIDVDDGMIRVERTHGTAGRCDHNEITHHRWNGTAFMPVGEVKRTPCRCM